MKKLQLKKDNQIFSRFEFKYIINKNISKIIQQEVKNFTINDFYNDKEDKYYVRSLYFDNNIFSNFNEKVDGIKNRHKFRIRTYSRKKNELIPLYLEMKGRDNQRTFKNRTKIKYQDLNFFCKGKDLFNLKKKYFDNELLNQFIFDSYRKKIQPKVIIDYNRRALLSRNGLYFRLTFDSDIHACSSDKIFEKNHNWKICIPGNDILEVKFDLTIPPWFHRIIQNYQLKRISVSKFVLGIESTNLAHDYEGI